MIPPSSCRGQKKMTPLGPGRGRRNACGGSMVCACACAEAQPLLSSQAHGSMVWGPEMLAELMEVLYAPCPILSSLRFRYENKAPSWSPSISLCLCLFFSFTPSIYAYMFQCARLTKCVCTRMSSSLPVSLYFPLYLSLSLCADACSSHPMKRNKEQSLEKIEEIDSRPMKKYQEKSLDKIQEFGGLAAIAKGLGGNLKRGLDASDEPLRKQRYGSNKIDRRPPPTYW